MVAIVTGSASGLLNSSLGVLGTAGQVGSAGQGSAGEQVVVNAATGNLILQRQDEWLRGLGPDAGLLRTYNSQGLLNDDNADNWRLGFSRKVHSLTGTVNTAGSTITRTDEDGADAVYTYDAASGIYRSHDGAGALDTLAFDGTGWTWRDGDTQSAERYTSHTAGGKLTTVTDRNGNALTLAYTGDLLTQIQTANGERIRLVYDTVAGKTANLLEVRTEYKNAVGDSSFQTLTRVRYAYDAANRLASVTLDLTPGNNSVADGRTYVTSYTYDGASKRVASIVQTDGSEVRFTYDASLRVATVSDVRSATDIRVTTFNYAVANQTSITNALGQVTTLAYDAGKRLTGITESGSGTTAYAYDANGNVTQVTDARGKVTVYTYDARNNRIYERDAAGNVVERTYSATNQLLSETTYRTPDPDGAGAQLPILPQTVNYVYNAAGNLHYVLSAEGRVTEFLYDAQGRETSRIRYTETTIALGAQTEAAVNTWVAARNRQNAQRTDTAYDFRGQVQKVSAYAALTTTGIGTRDGTQSDTWFVYDQAGQLLQAVDARGVATTGIANDYVTTYTYDGLGRMLATSRTDGDGTSLTLSGTAYNDAARQSTVTLAGGLVTTTTYDKGGRAVSVVQTEGTAGASQQVGRTDYVYNKLGLLVAKRVTTGSGSVLSSYLVYDDAGREVADIDATGAMTEYGYNANDQVTQTIRFLGFARNLSMDPASFTLADTRPAVPVGQKYITRQVYDDAGRVVKTIDAGGAVTAYQYDGAGRLVRTVASANLLTVAQISALNAMPGEIAPSNANTIPVANSARDHVTRQFYSDDGLLLGTLDAAGYLTENAYDAAGNLVHTIAYATQTASAQRANGALAAVRPASNATQDSHNWKFFDSSARVAATVNAEGYITIYGYYGTVVSEYSYVEKSALDPSAIDMHHSLNDVLSVSENFRRTDLTYDELGRLISKVRFNANDDGKLIVSNYYDVAGNLVRTTSEYEESRNSLLYRYDTKNQLIGEASGLAALMLEDVEGLTEEDIDEMWAEVGITHTYDDAGHRISSTAPYGNKSVFYYDADGRLVYSVSALGDTVQHSYNALGQLTQTTQFATRLDPQIRDTLTGGVADADQAAMIAGLANANLDRSVSYTYNPRGEMSAQSIQLGDLAGSAIYRYDSSGNLVRRADSNGIVLRYVYDAANRLIYSIDAAGGIVKHDYDAQGHVVSITTYATAISLAQLTTLPTVASAAQVSALLSTNANDRVTRTVYDRDGRAAYAIDATNHVTLNTYDETGNIVRATRYTQPITLPVALTTASVAAAVVQVASLGSSAERYIFDASNRLLIAIDSSGMATINLYVFNNLPAAIFTLANAVTIPEDITDPEEIRSILEENSSAQDEITGFIYDDQGHLAFKVDPQGYLTEYVLDASGNLLKRRNYTNAMPILANLVMASSSDFRIFLQSQYGSATFTEVYPIDEEDPDLSVNPEPPIEEPEQPIEEPEPPVEEPEPPVEEPPVGPVPASPVDARGVTTVLDGNVGAAVNTATGNLVLQRQDDVLAAIGLDVHAVRTYNSQGLRDDDNADNWRIGLYKGLTGLGGTVNTAGSTVRRTDGDGVERTYAYDTARGLYVNKDGSGSFDTLTFTGSQWSWTDGDSRVTETYSWQGGSGRLLSVADADGALLTYTCTGKLLTSVRDASGQTTYLDYTGNNLSAIRTVTSTGLTSTRVRYGYDSSNRLTSVTVDLTPGDNSVADGGRFVTTYTYDGASNRIASVTQSDGTQLGFTYATFSDGSVRLTQFSQTVAGTSRVTTIAYDLANRTATLTDPLGNATIHRYDAQGRLTSQQAPAVAGVSQSVSYTYDADGNVATQTDALGHVTTYGYDANGNQLLQRDAMGNTITRTYGSKNELLTQTAYATADADGAGAGQPSAPLTTRYAYDANNRLRFVVSAAGRITEYRYNALGQQVSAIAYAGNLYNVAGLAVTQALTEATVGAMVAGAAIDQTRTQRTDTTYDLRGQVASVTQYKSIAAGGVGSNATQTLYVYDQAGQLLQTIESGGGTTSHTYDGMGRLLGTTDALGNITLHQYASATHTTTTVAANGLATTQTYNGAGELISVTQANGATALGSTQYWYDAAGRLRMTQDPTGVRQYHLYDAAGRKVAEIDGNGSLTQYRYNAANQVVQVVHSANAVSATALASLVDAGGKPTAVTLASILPAANAADRSTWNLYDNANRLVKRIDELGYVTELLYDGASRVVATVQYATAVNVAAITAATRATDAAATPAANAASDRRTRSFHDADGQLLGTLDAEGYLTEHEYDAAGNRIHTVAYATQTASAQRLAGTLSALRPAANAAKDIHTRDTFDAQARIVTSTDGEGYVTTYAYDVRGNLASQTRGGLSTLFAYNVRNQLASKTDSADGTVTRYTYDSVGNLVATDVAFGTPATRTQTLRYDLQGRLVGELNARGAAALALLVAPTPAQVDALWSQYGVTHVYDAAGRRTRSTDANGNRTVFYYDTDGQLTHSVNALGELTQHTYNALGQLTKITRYAARVATATLASLTGGLAGAAQATMVAALANATLDSSVSFTYSLRGELTGRSDELGTLNSTSYNAFGDVRSITTRIDASTLRVDQYDTDHRGLQTGATENLGGLNRITQAVYDAFGRVTSRTDGNGRTSSQQYDRLGRVVQTTDPLLVNRSTTYDAFDRVLTQQDGNGQFVSSTYNDATHSVTVTTAEGVSTTTTRNAFGEIVQVTDGKGNISRYTYDLDGNLTGIQDGAGAQSSRAYDQANRLIDSVDARGVHTSTSYDTANRVLVRTVDPGGLNLATSYGYDAQGQVVTITDGGIVTQTVYDRKGQVSSVTVDPTGLNLKTAYTYDATGNTLTVVEGAGSPAARTTQYTYDALGRRIVEVVDPTGLALTTRYAYDASGNMVKKTDANGNVSRYGYDSLDRLSIAIDATGALTRTRYDAGGRVIAIDRYKALLNVAAIADTVRTEAAFLALLPAGTTFTSTQYLYNRDSQQIYSVDALGVVQKVDYDKAGNVVARTTYANPVPLSAGASTTALTAALVLDATRDQARYYAYDAANRLTHEINAMREVVKYDYDANGQVVRTRQYNARVSGTGLPTLATLNALATSTADRITQSVYDNAGRVLYAVDNVYVTRYTYDARGNRTGSTAYALAVSGLVYPLTAAQLATLLPATVPTTDAVLAWQYDAAGRLLQSQNSIGVFTRYTYDALGRTATVTQSYGTSGASTTRFAYDQGGRVVEQTVAFGSPVALVTRFAYDALGNRIAETDARGVELAESNSAWAQAQRKALGYTAADGSVKLAANLTALEKAALLNLYTSRSQYDAAGRKTVSTDALGNVTRSTYDTFGNLVKLVDPLGRAAYFYYDADNRRTLYVDPEGYATRTEYRFDDQVAKTTVYATRASGAWSETTPPTIAANAANDRVTQYLYDKEARTTQVIDAQGFDELRTYNAFGNLISLRNKLGGITSYIYDTRGLLLYETLPVTSANAAGVQIPVVNRYTYDARGNRLTSVEAYGLPEQCGTIFTYDLANRIVRKRMDIVASLDANYVETTSRPSETYTYDARGNLAVVDFNGRRTVSWYDAANRKIAEATATGTLTTWTLDAAGNSIGKTVYGTALALPVIATVPPVPLNPANARTASYRFNANNVLVGSSEVAASGYSYAGGLVTDTTRNTASVIDGNGNVVKTIDGNGNAVHAFFDRVGNRILQVDAEGYGIAWEYNAAGQVTRERRFASSLPAATLAALNVASDAAALALQFGAGAKAAEDRITEMTYDRMGQVVQQKVLNVAYASINATTGAQTEGVAHAITAYEYNGLGKVSRQTDANGKVTDMGYDALGRETIMQLASFTDFEGATVRQTVSSLYNGLGQLKTVTQQGKVAADNRVQQYAYNANGVMTSHTDALGNVTTFALNAFSETVQTTRTRVNADQTTVVDTKRYVYDGMGRQTREIDVVTGTTQDTRYDAYGQVTGKGTNGVYSEVTEYNAQGQVWRTSAGDGVSKAFVYDAAGNVTLSIESWGANLLTMTLAQMLETTLVAPTITVYDRRNQVTDVIQPKMQFTHQDAAVQSFSLEVPQDPFTAGAIGMTVGGAINMVITPQAPLERSYGSGDEGRTLNRYLTGFSINLAMPDSLAALSNENLQVDMTATFGAWSAYVSGSNLTGVPQQTASFTSYISAGVTSTQFTALVSATLPGGISGAPNIFYANGNASPSNYNTRPVTLAIVISKLVNGVKQTIGTVNQVLEPILSSPGYNGGGDWIVVPGRVTNASALNQEHRLYFKGQPGNAAAMKLKYRPAGSGGGFSEVWVPRLQVNGVVMGGAFAYDWAGIPPGPYEYEYESYDGANKVLSRANGQFYINGTASAIWSHNAQQPTPIYITQLKWVLGTGTAAENQIHQRQEHNAFGDITTEIDGLGRRTDFTYNTLGKLLLKADPETSVTLANGFITRARPETRYTYDLLGQTVGVRDANGNFNTLRYLDGLAAEPQVAQEYHADGGKRLYQYDAFGQLRTTTDELGALSRNTYDKNGNLVLVNRDGPSDDTYEYDLDGNRIAHTNGLGNRETWRYDSMGRIVQAISFAGRATATSYAWDGSITALGNTALVGGWLKTVTDANGRTAQDKSDVFGRIRWSKDLGNHTVTYSYNAAGWLATQVSSAGQNLSYAYYYNGYVNLIADNATNSLSKYEYDNAGNRTFEGYTSVTSVGSNGSVDGREYYQYANITYDELNRVKTVLDSKYRIDYEYDAASNRRRVLSTYHNGVGGNVTTQDYWYKYDSMNRFTLTKGTLAGGRATSAAGTTAIIKGVEGVELGYDLASQRITAAYADHSEAYEYRYGALTNTYIGGVLRASRDNLTAAGAMSNEVKYIEYNANGTVRTNSTYTYDADNKLITDRDNVTDNGTTYSYLADGTLSQTVTFGSQSVVHTEYAYEWWDSAKEKEIMVYGTNPTLKNWRPGFSRMTYDVNGNLKLAEDVAGGRSLRYVTNGEGLILSRNEIVGSSILKTHNWYYANGHQVGDTGNDGQSLQDYAQELAQDKGLTRKEINQRFKPVAVANFDQNYQPINATYPALTAGSYVVKSGDTLQTVAMTMWGDASLWYLIADANGLTANSALPVGISLVIPNKVTNIHNNSSTFKVYNPGEKIGDTSPTLPDAPKPPKAKEKCGGFGDMILMAIAVVVTVYTGNPILGNVVTQAVGVATGIQEEFNWKSVALSVITQGVSEFLPPLPVDASVFDTAVRAATVNAASQGIGVVTGLQKKFDWRGVAASAIGVTLGVAAGGGAGGRLLGGLIATAMAGRGRFDPISMGTTIGSVIVGPSGGDELQYSKEEANQDLHRELARFDRQAPPPNYDDGMSAIYANRAGRTISFEGLSEAFEDALDEIDAENRWIVSKASDLGIDLRPTNATAYRLGLIDPSDAYRNSSSEGYNSAGGNREVDYSSNPMSAFEEMVGARGADADETFKVRVNGGINAVLGGLGAIASAPIAVTPFGAATAGYSLSVYAKGIEELASGEYSQSPISKAVQWSFPTFTTQEADLTDGLLGLGTGMWGIRNVFRGANTAEIGAKTPGTAIQTYWPPNGGFVKPPIPETLGQGYQFSRYGGFFDESRTFKDFGSFVAPTDVPYGMRALPPGSNWKPLSTYEVLKPIPDVPSGLSAPYFGELGLGKQHQLPLTIQDYLDQGFIRLIDRHVPKKP